MNDLSLEIRFFDDVKINDSDAANAGCGEVHSHRRAESAGADHEHARGFEFALTLHADFRHDQVTAVAQDLFVGEFR